MTIRERAERSRAASLEMIGVPDDTRRRALCLAANRLEKGFAAIDAASISDMERAEAEGLAAPLLKRLRFDAKKCKESCEGLRALAAIPDPLGVTQRATELAEGLELYRVSCPIGVVGVVFESRPDALVQIAGLCIRSGNAVLLKGGREALLTNRALFAELDAAAREAGLPEGWGALLETREDVGEMLALDELIDLIIPRGSNEFVRHIMQNSSIPVLGHADGVCHVYVDAEADVRMAIDIAADSKTQYVAVCNAMETLLVHESVAKRFLPALAEAIPQVTLRGCERTRHILPHCAEATEADWDTEYLDEILSIKIVDSAEEAIRHINRHGSGHTDAIVTQNAETARDFCARVDSANVFHNCSTRFSDGYRYGLGAEVGIATGKLHARGPMGVEGLCTYKYKLIGHGQTVGGSVSYTHRALDNPCPYDGGEALANRH